MQVAACTFRRTMTEDVPPKNTSQKVVLTQEEKDQTLLASTLVADKATVTNPHLRTIPNTNSSSRNFKRGGWYFLIAIINPNDNTVRTFAVDGGSTICWPTRTRHSRSTKLPRTRYVKQTFLSFPGTKLSVLGP